jgi:DNA-binding ferritin-like protein
LPQNGTIRADADIVSESARDYGDAAIGTLKDTMIAACSHVTPARFFEDLDYFTNLEPQHPSVRGTLRGRLGQTAGSVDRPTPRLSLGTFLW